RFFGRYLHLGGVCGDASGLERELWGLYSLGTWRAGPPPAAVPCPARAFRASAARREALVAAVRTQAAGGRKVLVALRSPAKAQAVSAALREAGMRIGEEVSLTLHPAQRQAEPEAPGNPPLHLIVAELHDARRHI